ncbi:SLAP domain-containing protein [Lactobacillus sp. W8089]|nr:SLAP domain-containing protein [Lactobacillus sp. W8086]MBI0108331.1 SLAP domain-containing protein [Lactobacillus sp. W8085]MBI0111549.1 SLAP domain-containing protein [Lactobacillus sp. W8088]MBI0115264.1 SLAP domain-containing protein [Lactobacillus sp. W8087]MBI0118989.1 SLAP domain-containing protein [Lactobacillus sp. W8089]MBI0130954.1 SLAP domain-containing protein [Lactobacillus sp. W8090]
MKKSSLMGASVVAAALLAAAPVVAPVASLATPGTQVVKADTTEKQDVTNYINKLIGTLKGNNSDDQPLLLSQKYEHDSFAPPTNQLHDENDTRAKLEDGFDQGGQITNGQSEEVNMGTAQHPDMVRASTPAEFSDRAFQNNALVSPSGNELAAARNHVKYSLTYTANYANGRTEQKYSTWELATAVKDLQKNGGSLTAHYQFFNTYDNSLIGSADPVVTFKPQSLSKATFVTVNDTTVPNGTSVDTFNSRGAIADNGGKVLNEKGENVISSLDTWQFDINPLKYDAVAGKKAGDVVPAGTTLKEGTYTQELKFNPVKMFGSEDSATAADNAGRISFNGQSLADIKANKVAGMSYSADGWVTITRKVTVGKPGVTDAPYKAETVDGIVTVTTKEGTAAQVYDQAGNPVYSRALAPGSRWVTGQKRTLLKNGKVYYQVSTNEFLSADDVSYAAKSASDSEHLKGAVKVTQIGNKVFTIAEGNYGYVWAKDDDNNGMHLVKSRFLAPNSKWQSGAKANMTDSNGNTHEFYQVSTNEWIDGSVGSIN